MKVKCKVYDAKPAATITWEYGEKKLDNWNTRKCLDSELKVQQCFSIISESFQQINDPSLWTTEHVLKLKLGKESRSELKCLAHHPALNSPQRTAITLEMVDRGEFKM